MIPSAGRCCGLFPYITTHRFVIRDDSIRRPVLRLVPALSSAAQQLADELAASNGSQSTPLMERLSGRGTFSGSAGEAVVYGMSALLASTYAL